MTAMVIPFPPAPRMVGTTDWDLRVASAFVRGRPGWAVEQRAGGRGRVIAMRTPGEGWSWTVIRDAAGLTLENPQAGICLGPAPLLRDLLVELYEAETDPVQLGLQRTGSMPG